MISHSFTFKFDRQDFVSGKIKARAVLQTFQRAAVEHAERAGLGFDDMIRQNYIWVVLKIKYKLLGALIPNREYRLVTYPRPKASIAYMRDYYIFDGEEQVVVGSSQWCILDYSTRRIVRANVDYEGEFFDREAFPEGFERIKPDGGALAERYRITEKDIDDNDHTNNCVYADMVDRVAGEGSSFLIHYAKESRLDDVIGLYVSRDDGTLVSGKLDDGTVIFTARVV